MKPVAVNHQVENKHDGLPTSADKVVIEGCKVCKRDDDHGNLLLCEVCNDEYHIYCLDPPLKTVPEGDFYCDKCHPLPLKFDRDGLDDLVAALPPAFTSRFGEIVWASGGPGFGYWPACIYDPRLVVGGARKLALKNLGKKHLVYFFECHDAPFTVLGDNKIISWEAGLVDEYDLGKTAKAMGKNRAINFEQALQAAIAENDKPVELRLDWNHEGESHFINVKRTALAVKSRNENAAINASNNHAGTRRNHSSEDDDKPKKRGRKSTSQGADNKDKVLHPRTKSPSFTVGSQANLSQEILDIPYSDITSHHFLSGPPTFLSTSASMIEHGEDAPLYITIYRVPAAAKGCDIAQAERVAFITLPSLRSSTFGDARKVVKCDVDEDILFSSPRVKDFRFYIPSLGPMSLKQEEKVGSIFSFVKNTMTDDESRGDGTGHNPFRVYIVERE